MKKLLIASLIFLGACGSANPCDPDMLDCSECADEILCIPNPEFPPGPDGEDVIPDSDEPERPPDAEVL